MNLYEALAINRTASADEIKQAYRKLALKYHPDRNPDDPERATEQFKIITSAYEVLSDVDKRFKYDSLGYVGRRPPVAKPQAKEPKPKTKEDFEAERKKPEPTNSAVDFSKINCTFFGGSGTGRNIMVQLKLTPSEMKNGCTQWVTIKKRECCKGCVGDGKRMRPCPVCARNGITVNYCPMCDGVGAIEQTCSVCNGEGVHRWVHNSVKVIVSPNSQPGHMINVLGEGEEAASKPPGNLRVVIIS